VRVSASRDPQAALEIGRGSWAAWGIALRPKTLWIATVPVLVATCLAWSLAGAFDPAVAVATLAASVLIQAVTNLQNDVGYTERLAAGAARVGLPRATANGLLAPRDVRVAIVVAVGVTVLVGLPLVIRGGWPIFVAGAA
jgi:1,4-dihydroxy-2-naphthoate octaprenyltransferase